MNGPDFRFFPVVTGSVRPRPDLGHSDLQFGALRTGGHTRALVNIAEPRTARHAADHCPDFDLMADSGAFAAFRSGVPADRERFLDSALGLKDRARGPVEFVSLDVVHDQPTSDRNWHWLREQGLGTVPVFQYGGHLDALRELLTFTPRVALGGLVPYWQNRALVQAWLERVCTAAQDVRQGARLHQLGLGHTGYPLAYREVASADSSGWATSLRYHRDHDRLARKLPPDLKGQERGYALLVHQARKIVDKERTVNDHRAGAAPVETASCTGVASPSPRRAILAPRCPTAVPPPSPQGVRPCVPN